MKKIEPVAWQFYEGGKWWNGDDRIKDHRKNTEDAGIPTRDLYTREALEAVAEAAVLATFEAIRDSGNYPAGADMPDIDIVAIINQLTGECA